MECEKLRQSVEASITKHFINPKSIIPYNIDGEVTVKPIRFAYADPPYPGCAKRHYAKDPSGIEAKEVDHRELIELLMTFDAWALSTHTPALRDILPMCPPDVRLASWVKPFCSYKPNVRVAYAWEPLLFYGARKKQNKKQLTIRDWVSENITMRRGTHGAKPDRFCFWLFEVIGLSLDDEFYDLFPGSGAVTLAWKRWRAWKKWLEDGKTGYDLGLNVINDFIVKDMQSQSIHRWAESDKGGTDRTDTDTLIYWR